MFNGIFCLCCALLCKTYSNFIFFLSLLSCFVRRIMLAEEKESKKKRKEQKKNRNFLNSHAYTSAGKQKVSFFLTFCFVSYVNKNVFLLFSFVLSSFIVYYFYFFYSLFFYISVPFAICLHFQFLFFSLPFLPGHGTRKSCRWKMCNPSDREVKSAHYNFDDVVDFEQFLIRFLLIYEIFRRQRQGIWHCLSHFLFRCLAFGFGLSLFAEQT